MKLDKLKMLLQRIIPGADSTRPTPQNKAGGEEEYKTWVPLGHFYSPFPDIEQIRKREAQIWGKLPETISGIDLYREDQLKLLDKFASYYAAQPFKDDKQEGLRYYFVNPSYSYADAFFLYCMIRHLKPKRLIEVGSGYSSCASLDTNELFLNSQMAFTFVEPFPENLLSLTTRKDKASMKLIPRNIQDVDLGVFSELQANDILFIDSTHVSKTDSDVNYIFFELLPSLNKGVYIHFHDIFYPFEYPKDWVYEGRGWSEAYVLRAFLQFNKDFKIVFFSGFLFSFYKDIIARTMPLCLKNAGGCIWIKKC
ncbi:MAG: class I SAM-dependent methyltransferase [Thermodesulfovibrionales bacterium]